LIAQGILVSDTPKGARHLIGCIARNYGCGGRSIWVRYIDDAKIEVIKQRTSVSNVVEELLQGWLHVTPKTEEISAVLNEKIRAFSRFRLLAYNSLQNDPLPFRTDHEYR
jgi:hypothetical protein